MHRSGTSALAGMLTKVGVAGPTRPWTPNQFNEKGYFESRVICQMMDAFLASAHSSWDDWRRLDLRALPRERLAAATSEFAAAVGEEFGDAPLFVLKDPRNARAVALWFDVLREAGAEPYAIIPIRDPHEVALSLGKRDHMPGDKAALVWIRHMLDAERFTRGIPRAFVAFDALLGEPVGTLDRVAELLRIEWPVSPRAAEEALKSFVDQRLVHHRAGDAGANGVAGPSRWYRPLLELLSDAMRSKSQTADTAKLDALEKAFYDETAPFAHYFGAVESAIRQQNRTIRELRQTLHDTRRALDAATAAMETPAGGGSPSESAEEAHDKKPASARG